MGTGHTPVHGIQVGMVADMEALTGRVMQVIDGLWLIERDGMY
jgi:hypothetical protein